MINFKLKDSDEYYLCLSDKPKRFDAASPATNVFFDDTNGQVFTVRSGGVTGVTVTGMDESKCTSFRMEDRGPIISIKFSPDQKILAIQRNNDNQNATVEFVNFKDLAPTNVEYSHTCKWKNAKMLGFVWPKVNEIAFITDHGIELLQVLSEKKQLKSLKNTTFSGAWFQWCALSNTVVLAGNNGLLLQPFSLNNSSITKLQKLEMDASRPVAERDVFVVRTCGALWCAVFRHGTPAAATPTEVWLMAISGGSAAAAGACGAHVHVHVHVLQTGLAGRFAVSVVDDLLAVHHQSSESSQLFDIMEEGKVESGSMLHAPVAAPRSLRPALLDNMPCPMYAATWVMFQPRYVIDARLGCLWSVQLETQGLLHCVAKDEIARTIAVLLRRADWQRVLYSALRQLVDEARNYLPQLGDVFDEINAVYRQWAEAEMARNTAGSAPHVARHSAAAVVSQADMCTHVLQLQEDSECIVQVVTSYMSSLARHEIVVQQCVSELCVRALVTRGAGSRLRALARRGALGESKPLACALLSLAHDHPAHHQLALDMMTRLNAHQEIIEVLLSCNDPISGVGVARQAGGAVWAALPARKLLGAASRAAPGAPGAPAFVAVWHALLARNERARGDPAFLKGEQCDSYLEYYKQLTDQ